MYCMQCGKQFNEEVGVCPYCGTVTGQSGNGMQVPPPPQPLPGGQPLVPPQNN